MPTENGNKWNYIEAGWILNFQSIIDTQSAFSIDISDRFISLSPKDPKSFCSISNFRIDKVISIAGKTIEKNVYSELFEIDKKGVFSLKSFS